MKRCMIAAITVLVLCLLWGGALAETQTSEVATKEQLIAAVNEVNQSSNGEFIISLISDIEMNSGISFNSDATKSILGNGHTITYTGEDDFLFLWSGELNLGSAAGDNALTIKGTGDQQGNDSASLIQVVTELNTTKTINPVMNMYDGVTLCDYWTSNSRGGAIRVYTNNYVGHTATFNMYGGTIQNCQITNTASNAQGGGVHISDNGLFNMYGGKINNCVAKYGGGVCMGYYDTPSLVSGANAPQFNMYDGEITKNGTGSFGGAQGGGVAVMDGTFTMYGGEISENSSSSTGGGIVVYYGGDNNLSGAVQIDGGHIYGNKATSYGGGIASWGATVTMTSGILCNNTSTVAADDIFVQRNGTSTGLLNLSSASAMNQKLKKDGNEERFMIDGWYFDLNYGSIYSRWNYDEAFKDSNSSSNTYVGDTIYDNGLFLKAAFTAYDEIQVEKTWEDEDNVLGKRPESLTFTLVDATTLTPIKLRTYDYEWISGGADAKITLNAADFPGNVWTGSIRPLLIDDYSDTTKFLLKEEDSGIFYQLKANDPTITFRRDTLSNGTTAASSGVYDASFTNIGQLPVTIVKIWDDVNNKDNLRPTALNTQLVIGTVPQPDMDGIDVFTLAEDPATHTWTKKVYLPAKDYSALQATEGNATGYQQTNYNRSVASDGTLNFVFVNKHTLAAAATDTVRNDNMVNINYQAAKVWEGTNPVGDKQLPRPQVTVILTDNIGSPERTAVIPANADPATALFENLPKYKDNDGNEPITYTIREEITDPDWVKAGENLWYSLDGMGKYEGAITNVTATDVENTDALGTVTGGKATNTYSTLQTTTTVAVTKLWKDHQNENGVRPEYLKLGLFKNASDAEPVATVTLTGPNNNDAWTGTFTGLPIYDTNGQVIDYSTYVVQEAYPATLKPDGTPASWSAWIKDGGNYDVTDTAGHTYTYDYSIVTNP